MRELDVGETVGGKYVLVRLLGHGAMGQVWLARHQALGQTFALKLMVPDTRHEELEISLKRFENEAQIAAALSRKSRHIVGVSDYGVDDGAPYLVMELLEGEGLDSRIGYGRTLEPAVVSTLVTQIAKGLGVAHAEGVTHRDLKPANVFLARTEEGDLLVKVLDFGIARMARHIVKKEAVSRLTAKGVVLGSPGYMSPEQALAGTLDVRADVWALAVVAYEALAGITPFFSTDGDGTIARICDFDATPLRALVKTASVQTEAVFNRAFARKISARFQTAASFAEALAATLPAPVSTLSPTNTQSIGAAQTPTERGVSLRASPVMGRSILSAVAVGGAIGVLVAGAMVAQRVLGGAHATSPPVTEVRAPPAQTLSAASIVSAAPVVNPTLSSVPIVSIDELPTRRKPTTSSPALPVSQRPPPPPPPPDVPTNKPLDRSAVF